MQKLLAAPSFEVQSQPGSRQIMPEKMSFLNMKRLPLITLEKKMALDKALYT